MRYVNIFNISFVDATPQEAMAAIDKGGLLVAPAAPALTLINIDNEYYNSLKKSDVVIFDSGFLCLLLLLLKFIKVRKLSGLEFLRYFMENIEYMRNNSIFLIDPTPSESKSNRELFHHHRYILAEKCQYIAPIYPHKNIQDNNLLLRINEIRTKYILINIGGGIQEKLGLYIRDNLPYNPSIICTGAAISFISGHQASISPNLDKLYCGWLVRCFFDYKRFVPRYLKGFLLIIMLLKEKIIIRK
jgi:UDP-N-acetyl-D-mannosaminuronic acid transferase (WecB/TagA/CpsF family)